MELNNLKYKHGSRGHKRKISGRGFGSYSIRGFKGNKGQGQRNTGNVRVGFEGGQTPLYRRTRKIGFNNYEFKTNYNVFSLQQLSQLKLTEINRETLKKALDNAR
jgi:large subunit ribosomal protein L15